MLGSPADDILKHAERAIANQAPLDLDGAPLSYDAVLEKADLAIDKELLPDVVNEKVARCQSGIDRLATALADTRPDVVVIIGDDQHEQFLEDNQPAVLICSGETSENGVLPLPANVPECWKKARSHYHEVEQPREYPVASGLAPTH